MSFSEFKNIVLNIVNNITNSPDLGLKISAVNSLFEHLDANKDLWIHTTLAEPVKTKITEFSQIIPGIIRYKDLFFPRNIAVMDIDE